jgi:hypothetical protein
MLKNQAMVLKKLTIPKLWHPKSKSHAVRLSAPLWPPWALVPWALVLQLRP